MAEKYLITEEGLKKLKEELHELIHVTREEVKQEVAAARALGDSSENSDLDAAKAREGRVAERISELEKLINNAEIINEKKKSNYVTIGSSVEIQELDTKAKFTYKIVGKVEADPLQGLLSNVAPLGEALLNHKVNDVVTVKSTEPYDVKILKIN